DDALIAAGFRVVQLNEHPKTEWEKTSAGFRRAQPNNRFKAQWDQAQVDGGNVAMGDGFLSDRKYLDKSGVSLVTQATIRLGEVQYNTTYIEALKRRRPWQKALQQVFQEVDLIAVPTLQSLPPRMPVLGRSGVFELQVLALQNTVAVNLAGNPAIAIPIPLPGRGFPVTSLQLIGPKLSEAELVNAARIIAAAEAGARSTAQR
ncbi:MAG: amidase family protein, partial [Chthoniobacterales bacterium]